MSLDPTEVHKIAILARLKINDNEVQGYVRDLSRIIDLVSEMEQADTDGIEPMAHPHEATQRLRRDEVTETDQRERFQKLAPQTEAGLYLVPKVIE